MCSKAFGEKNERQQYLEGSSPPSALCSDLNSMTECHPMAAVFSILTCRTTVHSSQSPYYWRASLPSSEVSTPGGGRPLCNTRQDRKCDLPRIAFKLGRSSIYPLSALVFIRRPARRTLGVSVTLIVLRVLNVHKHSQSAYHQQESSDKKLPVSHHRQANHSVYVSQSPNTLRVSCYKWFTHDSRVSAWLTADRSTMLL